MSKKDLKVLVCCEESQAVTMAFRNLGIQAWSNDIQECSGTMPQYHLQMDCFKAVKIIKPTLLIGHPPCRYVSGAALYLYDINIYGTKAIERIKLRNKAVDFFLKMYSLNIPYICLENPTGFISSTILKPTQIIHPYYFGDAHLKELLYG